MRNTKTYRELRGIFEANHGPLCASEIGSLLERKNLHPNKTTIYRILGRLHGQGFIREVIIDNSISYYEKVHNETAHVHFICRRCTHVYCLDIPDTQTHMDRCQAELVARGFEVTTQHVSLEGVCVTCTSG